jgi:hypothetical protein
LAPVSRQNHSLRFRDAASYQAALIKSARHWLQSRNAARAAKLTKSSKILAE